jgi:mitochondrial splicing suppressor protein 51
MKGLRQSAPPVRLFILGARAESCLPREVWYQIAYLFPRSRFHLIFIGPESMAGRPSEPIPEKTPENPFGATIERVSNHMKISTFVEYYHTMHEANYFYPYDPYFDCFIMFHPGLGHAITSKEWEQTLPQLLSTKCPILVTGYTQEDMDRDVRWVEDKCKGEYDILLKPGENRFKSLRVDINDNDPSDISQGNWGVWAFRGKRYSLLNLSS